MRKVLIPIAVLVVAGIAAYFIWWKKDPAPSGPKPKPISVGENTLGFNQSFTKLLATYYDLRDALTENDSAKASAAAALLTKLADSLKTSEIKGDSTGLIKQTADTYVQTITGSTKAIGMESALEEKRKDFGTIAEALMNLIRTVKYNGQKVYWEYCPDAFNNKGAYWMSDSGAVLKNPYMGKSVQDCNNVVDSLDYSKK
jgi:Cu(I)/Ag(I) efflux system membrane fusion protein